ncbi:trp operon repressor [Ferrimonas gelatinilytica]|uniref:Trp operon repressor homolog n=1 Tax=Ferrimonas gelatinilytica TaxID=1255257 RepID=A0ABP9S9G1_9GAMM
MVDGRWQALLGLLAQESSEAGLDTLLRLLLSHDERQSVAGRLEVFKALLAGDRSQRQISADLGISIATITRASNTLKTLNSAERERLSVALGLS